MRGRMVRVRRRHVRSMRLAMALLAISLMIYACSYAARQFSPERAAEAVQEPKQAVPVADQLTKEVRFEPLSSYLVELAEEPSAESARIEAARYTRRGAAGYILQDGDTFRVIGAVYTDKAGADAVAARLLGAEKIAAKVVSAQGPASALRVTASQTQIDALTQGEASLRSLTDQLIALGQALDAGKSTSEQAAQQIQLIHAEAQLRLRALERAVGADEHPILRSLMLLLQQLSDATGEGMTGRDESTLSFSAKIKYNSITMRLRHIEFLDGLAA